MCENQAIQVLFSKWTQLIPKITIRIDINMNMAWSKNKAWSCSEDKVWVWKTMLLSWNMWVFYSNGIVNSCLFPPCDKILAMLLVCAFFRYSNVEFVSTFFSPRLIKTCWYYCVILYISREKSHFVRIKLPSGKPA